MIIDNRIVFYYLCDDPRTKANSSKKAFKISADVEVLFFNIEGKNLSMCKGHSAKIKAAKERNEEAL